MMLLKAALAWAEAGFFVFPCLPNRKEPATPRGHNDATRDAAVITAHWTANPRYNIGLALGPSGSTVLDADPPLGEATLNELQAREGALPRTLTIRTPRGGKHFYFDGKGPSSVGTDRRGLGPKLDTRGEGGYVLAPPSVIGAGEYDNNPSGGAYSYENDEEMAPLPAWVPAKIDQRREHNVAAANIELDDPGNVLRAVTHAERFPLAEEGDRNNAAYRLTTQLRDLGVSEETALELVEKWNARNPNPLDQGEVETCIWSAFKGNAQNDAGAFAVRSPQDAFAGYKGPEGGVAPVLAGSGETVGDARRLKRFEPMRLGEARDAKAPRWIIPGLVQANSFTVLYGKLKSFKTFLALDMCLGVAAGVETFGYKPQKGVVVYAVGEGQWNIAHSHAPAWQLARCVDEVPDFWLISTVPKAIMEGDFALLIKAIDDKKLKPEIIVIDTMARSIGGLDENNARDVGVFVAGCDQIREHFDCTVLVVHHAGKDAERGSRGSSALDAAADAVIEVSRHEKSTFVLARVKEQRNAPEREEPYYFEGRRTGPSLAFFPVDALYFAENTQADNPTSKKHVAAALDMMGAKGEAKAVTLDVLAMHLATHHKADVPKVRKALKEGARSAPLNAYCDAAGLKWFLWVSA